jgi:hypothetical protein
MILQVDGDAVMADRGRLELNQAVTAGVAPLHARLVPAVHHGGGGRGAPHPPLTTQPERRPAVRRPRLQGSSMQFRIFGPGQTM